MINGINRHGINAYSSMVRNQQTSAPLSVSQLSSPSDTIVTISPQAINAIKSEKLELMASHEEEIKRGCLFLTGKVINEPEVADKVTYELAHSRDGELISLDEIPINGPTEKFKSMDDYLQHVSAFESIANNVQRQRQKIYSKMKAEGATGLEIYESIMKFNTTLPADYQKATRINISTDTFFNYPR